MSHNPSHFFQQQAVATAFGKPEVGWVILSSAEARIKAKIEEAGTPLKEWDIQINYGIKTGFNEAFIIDGKTKDELIRKSPNSADIIRPLLRGKDIKKYTAKSADLWLINTHNGLKNEKLKRILVEEHYPAVFEHLLKYKDQLINREDQGDTWMNLRNCAYLHELDQPKIIYPEITKFLPFVYDENKYYLNNKTFFITGEHLKYLTAFLNSNLFKIIFKSYFPDLGEDRTELRKVFFEQINIMKPTLTSSADLSSIVDLIISHKQNGLDTKNFEHEIDSKVYGMYNLNDAEIRFIKQY